MIKFLLFRFTSYSYGRSEIFFLPLAPHFGAEGWYLSFLIILQTVGLLERVTSSSQGLYLNTENTHTHQTSMPWVGFEPTSSDSEPAKTVHALDSSSIMIGDRRLQILIKRNKLLMNLNINVIWNETKPHNSTQSFHSSIKALKL
jgi:hypothetical protein